MEGFQVSKILSEDIPNSIVLEILLLITFSTIVFIVAVSFDVFELSYQYCVESGSKGFQGLIILSVILVFALMIFSFRRWKEYKTELHMRLHAEEGLKEANRKLSLLTRITRHDIKNKIQAIYLYSELLGYSEDDQTKENAAIIMNEAESIENLISFTKIYEELGSTEPQWYNIADAFREVACSEEFVTLKILTDTCDVEIYADPLFSKAIYNLIENAVRHGDYTTSITITCEKGPKNSLLIHCKDNGVGIPEEKKSLIFNEGVGKNTGLGLFLIQEILSITQISISEVGIEGEGADFLISVPEGHWKH